MSRVVNTTTIAKQSIPIAIGVATIVMTYDIS